MDMCDKKFLIVGTIFNLAKVKKVPCKCAAPSLFPTSSRWIDSLAYIECITDAYFVNNIEHTENKQFEKCKLLLVPIT